MRESMCVWERKREREREYVCGGWEWVVSSGWERRCEERRVVFAGNSGVLSALRLHDGNVMNLNVVLFKLLRGRVAAPYSDDVICKPLNSLRSYD